MGSSTDWVGRQVLRDANRKATEDRKREAERVPRTVCLTDELPDHVQRELDRLVHEGRVGAAFMLVKQYRQDAAALDYLAGRTDELPCG